MGAFGRVSLYQDNSGEAASPGASNDATQGYSVGSRWFDTRYQITWYCLDATAGAAKWLPQTSGLIGAILGANMNSTADQPFSMFCDITLTKFAVSKILVMNASVSLTTAAGGIYDTAAKGGNAIVAAAQVYTALTAAAKLLALTIAAAGSGNVFSVAPILSLTTPQGAAATANFYLFGDILPQ
jgi:hypothetical protein